MLKRLQFAVTNNMAEYEACLFGLEALIAVKDEEVEVVGDFELNREEGMEAPLDGSAHSKGVGVGVLLESP